MESKELKEKMNELLYPFGFNRKGNSWFQETSQLCRIINLQKSYYGNSYYINYGFNIKGLNISDVSMHVFLGLGSCNADERKHICNILDLDCPLTNEKRIEYLKYFIEQKILQILLSISTEEELKSFLVKKGNTNDVFLLVKKYLNMELP